MELFHIIQLSFSIIIIVWCVNSIIQTELKYKKREKDYIESRTFRLNDKVKPNAYYKQDRRAYPWMPDFGDQVGTIFQIQTEIPETHTELEEPIYWVKFEKPFKVGIIPDGGHSCDVPTEWKAETEFCFLADKLVKV